MKKYLSLIVFLAVMVGAALLVHRQAGQLPERVASHFGASGKADGWMAREAEVRAVYRLVLAPPLFVIGLCYAIRFLPSRFLNVPNEAYWRTPENYSRACEILFRSSLWIGALMAAWAVSLHALIVAANRLTSLVLDSRGLAVITIMLAGAVVGWIVFLARRFSRVP